MKTFTTMVTAAVLFIGTGAVPLCSAAGTEVVKSYYAIDSGRIDVLEDSAWPKTLNRAFADAGLPAGYAPLGIANIDGAFFLVFALQNGGKLDEVAGPGGGLADVFDTDGHLIRRFAILEHPNSTSQIIEYVRLPANSARQIINREELKRQSRGRG